MDKDCYVVLTSNIILGNLDVPVVDNISVLASLAGTYYMSFIYTKNQSKVARLLKEMSSFENFGKPPNFDQKEQVLNFFSTFFFVYISVGIVQYDLLKFKGKAECEERNKNQDLTENCGFITPLWTPFSTQNVFVYYSFHVYIVFCAQLLMKPNMLITYNEFEITQHLVLRIKHLNQMICEAFDNTQFEISQSRLTNCILYHVDIIRYNV